MFVNASDGTNSDDQTVTVTVADVDDVKPVITGPSGGAGSNTSIVSINENSTAVHSFSATDVDTTAAATWTLNGGADASLFSITSAGVLSFDSAPDYETPGSASSSNSYEVVVNASDGTNSDNQTVTVTVSDVSAVKTVRTGAAGGGASK